jgi:ribonuclease-3
MAVLKPPGRLAGSFRRAELLRQALTHRSAGSPHNERLEFLGDAALNFLVAEEVFRRFPDAREGELTRLRARLVRAQTLAAVARHLDLGPSLNLGGGALKSGGRYRDSILADALEAVLGALYVDSGLEACRALVLEMYADLLETLTPAQLEKDPKTRLQEWLQARRMPLPRYGVVSVAGDDHEQWFTVSCDAEALGLRSRGEGGSRRAAEQAAAQRLLATLGAPRADG